MKISFSPEVGMWALWPYTNQSSAHIQNVGPAAWVMLLQQALHAYIQSRAVMYIRGPAIVSLVVSPALHHLGIRTHRSLPLLTILVLLITQVSLVNL
jgi:hypothetical protein